MGFLLCRSKLSNVEAPAQAPEPAQKRTDRVDVPPEPVMASQAAAPPPELTSPSIAGSDAVCEFVPSPAPSPAPTAEEVEARPICRPAGLFADRSFSGQLKAQGQIGPSGMPSGLPPLTAALGRAPLGQLQGSNGQRPPPPPGFPAHSELPGAYISPQVHFKSGRKEPPALKASRVGAGKDQKRVSWHTSEVAETAEFFVQSPLPMATEPRASEVLLAARQALASAEGGDIQQEAEDDDDLFVLADTPAMMLPPSPPTWLSSPPPMHSAGRAMLAPLPLSGKRKVTV
mmetsp:Transcript_29661/g.79628  ORF Transcript_29661/g.79628 Transcript_29661/m.79628 type:complete len:287 (+) Transcript_29661:33-893(+)